MVVCSMQACVQPALLDKLWPGRTHMHLIHICRFAEKHRRLLNTLLRQNSSLLQGSLSPLLKVPRLIEFDNKRSYFRARIHSTGDDHRRYGGLRLAVRRSHVFEDSFHQMRMRYSLLASALP